MADSITIKSGSLGSRDEMPKLTANELGYRTDEKALYIGTTGGNVKLCDANFTKAYVDGLIATINARLDALEK